LRYHWLLNDEKWCTEDFHWAYISRWQRPHISLVMKKFAGTIPFTLVLADEGKNGLEVPAPSSSMLLGGSPGLTMRYASRRRSSYAPACTVAHTPAATTTATAASVETSAGSFWTRPGTVRAA